MNDDDDDDDDDFLHPISNVLQLYWTLCSTIWPLHFQFSLPPCIDLKQSMFASSFFLCLLPYLPISRLLNADKYFRMYLSSSDTFGLFYNAV